jgi:hypothetical protein
MSGATSQTSPATSVVLADAAAGGSFTAQLADLNAQLEAASDRVRTARERLSINRYDAPYEATAPLVKFHDDIAFDKPSAVPEAEREQRERELIEQFISTVRERGLVLRPVRKVTTSGAPTSTIEVVDPSVSAEVIQAEADRNEIHRQVSAFNEAHAADLIAEARKADADRIKDALSGDDGDAIREALAPARS